VTISGLPFGRRTCPLGQDRYGTNKPGQPTVVAIDKGAAAGTGAAALSPAPRQSRRGQASAGGTPNPASPAPARGLHRAGGQGCSK